MKKLLSRLFRKHALVDFYGDVSFYRYHLFFYEPDYATRWWHWLPNIFVHFYPGEPGGAGPNGENPHSHPWTSLGFVVRGQYTERIDEIKTRINTAPALTYVKHSSFHRIVTVKPGTISIFMHGFRQKRDWLSKVIACPVLCPACVDAGFTACPSIAGVQKGEEAIDSGKIGIQMTWVPCDANFDERIERRRKALRRMNLRTPTSFKAKENAMKVAKLK